MGYDVRQRYIPDTHHHMAFCDRRIAVVHILVAVKDVILQQFQVRQVILGLPPLLVIVEHRPGMDAQPVKYICHDLVGRNVPVLLLKADVVPDHIVGIVEIAAF